MLNKNYMVIESIEGNLISDNYSIDSSSDIRRSYSLDMHVADSSFKIGVNKKIWFDKLIRPYIGIYSLRDKEIIWYSKGTFCFNEATYSYDGSSATLSLSCNDLMCMLTGDRNGYQTGLNFTIPIGENIRTSIIGIIKTFGFTKYKIPNFERTVQYDLNFNNNTSAYEMIKKLMEFCPNYEFFFDLDGTFVIQRIPCYKNDMDLFDDSFIENVFISEDSYSVDFTAKNCIEIWGKEFSEDNISRFTDQCSYSNNIYSATFEKFTTLEDHMYIGIVIPMVNQAGFKVQLGNLGIYDVIDDYGRSIRANVLNADTSYIFKYYGGKLYFCGGFNIRAIYKNTDITNPLSIQNLGSEVWESMSGGEYENITSDLLAKERAMYECYYKNSLNESLSLTLLDIPWLDVNTKISYTPESTNKTERWLIKSISGDTISGKCSISLSKFYPDWSEIFNQNLL